MTTRVPGIPAPTKENLLQIANAIKEVIEVREGVRGDPLDKAVTFRDLEALKLVQQKDQAPVKANINANLPVQPFPGVAPGAFKPDNYDESSDLTTPPAPYNLMAEGTYSAINLSWQYPRYKNHAYTEIYRSTANDLATAVLIGTSTANLYSDPVGTEKACYYWVRSVSQANVRSAYNSTGGTYAETAVDVEKKIAQVTSEITSSALFKSLGERVTKIEIGNFVPAAVKTALDTAQAKLDAKIGANGADLLRVTNITRDNATDITLLTARTGNAESSIQNLNSVTADQATKLGALTARVGTAESNITSLQQTTANQATSISQLTTTVSGNTTSIQTLQQTTAGLSAQYTVKIDNNGYVSGFGLASTVVNGTPTSAFIIRADKFAIASPSSTTGGLLTTPAETMVPFAVVGTNTYLKAAFIQDATITNAKIQSVAADKITAGVVTAAIDLRSPLVRSGPVVYRQAGFYLGQDNGVNKFYVGNGSTGVSGRSLEFDGTNTIVRGDIYAYNGTIGGCNITDSYVQSTNYSYLTTGWRLNSNGSALLNNVQAKGITIYNDSNQIILSSGSGIGPGAGLKAFAFLDQVTAANASTYIQSAAIGSAQIADASITNAKIGNAAITSAKIGTAEIGTLKIAGNAVTIPVTASQLSNVNFYSVGSWLDVLYLTVDYGTEVSNAQGIIGFTMKVTDGSGGAWAVGWRVLRGGFTLLGSGDQGVPNNNIAGTTISATVFEPGTTGVQTYKLQAYIYGDLGATGGVYRTVYGSIMYALGAKR